MALETGVPLLVYMVREQGHGKRLDDQVRRD